MEHTKHQHGAKPKSSIWKNPIVWVCIAAVGYWLYTYHLEHALGFLPYAILLLCPLLHIFMHGGHGHGGHSHGDNEKEGN
jgi:hypothetical protein